MFKNIVKGFLKLSIAVISLGLIIYFVLSVTVVPKTPATTGQVWEALVSLGYDPQDITKMCLEQNPNAKQNLLNCIAVQKDDIYFEFFMFNNANSAIDVYASNRSDMVWTKKTVHFVEYYKKTANYCIYTLRSSGTYSASIYVGNTAVYAYSDAENRGEINKILDIIGYMNLSNSGKPSNLNEKAISRLIFFFFMMPMNWLACRWLWGIVCKTAGVTKQEVREYRKKTSHSIKPSRKIYPWLLNKSNNSKKFKRIFAVYVVCSSPSLILFNLSLLGFMTSAFDTVLDYAGLATIGIVISVAFAGALYNRTKR